MSYEFVPFFIGAQLLKPAQTSGHQLYMHILKKRKHKHDHEIKKEDMKLLCLLDS